MANNWYNSWASPLQSYSEQLAQFIAKFKRRPPDIRYWPYGPYWPKYYDYIILETPKLLHDAVYPKKEPLWTNKDFPGKIL